MKFKFRLIIRVYEKPKYPSYINGYETYYFETFTDNFIIPNGYSVEDEINADELIEILLQNDLKKELESVPVPKCFEIVGTAKLINFKYYDGTPDSEVEILDAIHQVVSEEQIKIFE